MIYIFLFFKQKGTPPCSSRPSQGIYLSNPFNKSFQLLQLVGSSLPIQCAPMFQGVVILGMVCLGSRTALSLLLIYQKTLSFWRCFKLFPLVSSAGMVCLDSRTALSLLLIYQKTLPFWSCFKLFPLVSSGLPTHSVLMLGEVMIVGTYIGITHNTKSRKQSGIGH